MYFEGEDQEVSRSTADLNRTTTHPLVNGKRVEELATSIEPSNSSTSFHWYKGPGILLLI